MNTSRIFLTLLTKKTRQVNSDYQVKTSSQSFRFLTDLCQSVYKWVCCIQIDLSVVNLVVGDDFPDISDQKLPISMGYILNGYSTKGI